MQEQTKLVAMRIRELRDISGYTVSETARKLGVTEELYSRYELDGADIPISVIYAIAHLFKVDTTDILSGLSPKMMSLSLVKKGKGIKVERFEGYEYENIAYSFLHRAMEPMIVTLMPYGKEPKMVMHNGQEINFCLEGKMILYHDESKIVLEEGDCAYFDARKPHGQHAAGLEKARFLTVINE
ncbi:MAG: cupin domain-containing protein [Eubacterium sp.]|jgi:transcriptional regulator with XRE-family HTH domain|nr:cupin domain-containing protein [Eubacterium sp.]